MNCQNETTRGLAIKGEATGAYDAPLPWCPPLPQKKDKTKKQNKKHTQTQPGFQGSAGGPGGGGEGGDRLSAQWPCRGRRLGRSKALWDQLEQQKLGERCRGQSHLPKADLLTFSHLWQPFFVKVPKGDHLLFLGLVN